MDSDAATRLTFSRLKSICQDVMQVSSIVLEGKNSSRKDAAVLCAPLSRLASALNKAWSLRERTDLFEIHAVVVPDGIIKEGLPRCVDYILLPLLLMLPLDESEAGGDQASSQPIPDRLHEEVWHTIGALVHAAGPAVFCDDPPPAPGAPAADVLPRCADVLLRVVTLLRRCNSTTVASPGHGDSEPSEETLCAAMRVLQCILTHAAGLSPSAALLAQESEEDSTPLWNAVRASCTDLVSSLLFIAAALPVAAVHQNGGSLPDARGLRPRYGRSTRLLALLTLGALLACIGRVPSSQTVRETAPGPCPGPEHLLPILPGIISSLTVLAVGASMPSSRDARVRGAATDTLTLALTLALGEEARTAACGSAGYDRWLSQAAPRIASSVQEIARHVLVLVTDGDAGGPCRLVGAGQVSPNSETASHVRLFRSLRGTCGAALSSTTTASLSSDVLALLDQGGTGGESILLAALHVALLPGALLSIAQGTDDKEDTRKDAHALRHISAVHEKLCDPAWAGESGGSLGMNSLIVSLPPLIRLQLALAYAAERGGGGEEGAPGETCLLARAGRLWSAASSACAPALQEQQTSMSVNHNAPVEIAPCSFLEALATSLCLLLSSCGSHAYALSGGPMESQPTERGFRACLASFPLPVIYAVHTPSSSWSAKGVALGTGFGAGEGVNGAPVRGVMRDRGRESVLEIVGTAGVQGEARSWAQDQAVEACHAMSRILHELLTRAALSTYTGQATPIAIASAVISAANADGVEAQADAPFRAILDLLSRARMSRASVYLWIARHALAGLGQAHHTLTGRLLALAAGRTDARAAQIRALTQSCRACGSALATACRTAVACALPFLQRDVERGGKGVCGDEESVDSIAACGLIACAGVWSGRAFEFLLPSVLPPLLFLSHGGVACPSQGAAVMCLEALAVVEEAAPVPPTDEWRVSEAACRFIPLPRPRLPIGSITGSDAGSDRDGDAASPIRTSQALSVFQDRLTSWHARGLLLASCSVPVPEAVRSLVTLRGEGTVADASALAMSLTLFQPAMSKSLQALLSRHASGLGDVVVAALRALACAGGELLPWGDGIVLCGVAEQGGLPLGRQIPFGNVHVMVGQVVAAALGAHEAALSAMCNGSLQLAASSAALPLLQDVTAALLQALDGLSPGVGTGIGTGTHEDNNRLSDEARTVLTTELLTAGAQVVAAVSIVGAPGTGSDPHDPLPLTFMQAQGNDAWEEERGSVCCSTSLPRCLAFVLDRAQEAGHTLSTPSSDGPSPYSAVPSTCTGGHAGARATAHALALSRFPSLSPAAVAMAVRLVRAAARHMAAASADFSRDDGLSVRGGVATQTASLRRLRLTRSALAAYLAGCAALTRHPDTLHPLVSDTLASLLALLPPPGAIRLLPGRLGLSTHGALASMLSGRTGGATGVALSRVAAVPAQSQSLAQSSTVDRSRAFMAKRAAAMAGPAPRTNAARMGRPDTQVVRIGLGGPHAASEGRQGEGGGGRPTHGRLVVEVQGGPGRTGGHTPIPSTEQSEGVSGLTSLVHAAALRVLAALVGTMEGAYAGLACGEVIRPKFSADVWPRLRSVLVAAAIEQRAGGGGGHGNEGSPPAPSLSPRQALYATALYTVSLLACPVPVISRVSDVEVGHTTQEAAGRNADPGSDRGPPVPGMKKRGLLLPSVAGAVAGLAGHASTPYGSDVPLASHILCAQGGTGSEDEVEGMAFTLEPPLLRQHAWEAAALCRLCLGQGSTGTCSPVATRDRGIVHVKAEEACAALARDVDAHSVALAMRAQ